MGQGQSRFGGWQISPYGCSAPAGEETFLGQACGGDHSRASPLGTPADFTRTPFSIAKGERLAH